MTGHDDRYRDWDAAYVLGSLSADEQHEFERHLTACDGCATAVAELAEIPGLLAMVPADDVASLDEPEPVETPPADTFPRLVAAADAQRRRARRWMVAAAAALCALGAGLALVVVGFVGSEAADGEAEPVAVELAATDPAPISASVRLMDRPWGTQVEGECHYEPASNTARTSRYGSGDPLEYAMYVTDVDGTAHQVATWTALPGTTVTPHATVNLSVDQIASVDIRSMSSGRVLLERDV